MRAPASRTDRTLAGLALLVLLVAADPVPGERPGTPSRSAVSESSDESAALTGAEEAAVPPPAAAPAPSPRDPDRGRERAAALLLAGKAEEAASLYAETLTASPGDTASIEGRVRALIRAGRWASALDEARGFAAAKPNDPLVRTALGESLYRAGLLDEACTVLEPLVARSDPPARALMVLGMLRVAQGRDDDAGTLLDRALALAPQDRDVLFWGAGAARTRAEGIRALERYLALSDGDDPDRIDGAKGTIGLYRALGERRVWIAEERPEKIELPMRALVDRGRTSGFIVEIVAGPGVAEGDMKTIRVLLDTGSTGLFLLDRIAAKAGFTAIAEQTTFAGGGDGRSPSKRGLLPRIALGGLRYRDALVSTTTEEIEPAGRYHGVLSLSILDGYRVTLDLARERLIAEKLPAGSPSPQAAPPEGSPYWTVSSQMLVEATTSGGNKGLFLFDTGSTRSLISLALAEARYPRKLGGTAQVRTYGGNMKGARSVHGVFLRYQEVENVDGILTAADLEPRSRLSGVEVSGFLGLDLLGRSRVTIDTKTRRITVVKARR